MANHVRTQIRDALATLLTGLTTTGNRVYKTRVYPSGDTCLPGLSIFTVRDTLDDRRLGAHLRLSFELELAIEVRVKPIGTSFDTQMDTICAEVAAKISTNPTLSHLCRRLIRRSTDFRMTSQLEAPAGVATMTWRTQYTVLDSDETTSLWEG